ncbi:MAG: response regulator [Elusimicrobiota bacterium]
MDEKELEFKKRLQATFKIEAEEHARAISAGIIELGKNLQPETLKKVVESVFREVHTLKGAARVMNLKDIESICQPLESVFSALKCQEITLSPELCGLFHKVADTIFQLVASAGAQRPGQYHLQDRELIKLLASISKGTAVNDNLAKSEITADRSSNDIPISETTTPSTINAVRIPVNKLDPLLVQAEEMLQIKMVLSQRLDELQEIKQTLISLKEKSVESQEHREIFLNRMQNQVIAVIAAFERDQRLFGRMVDEQLETMKQVLMLPVASLLEVFPKFVHDLANDQGKEAELIIRGTEIEIDKRILEGLKDPLIHIIRNCIDHGIEKTTARVRTDKPPRGTITIVFTPMEGRQVEILITDDGKGIDVEQVRAAAIKSGVITENKARELSFQDTLSLIFQSGVSTSPIITDISGRGLGLAIVRERIDKLGGTVSLETTPGAGTTFRFLLPLSLSTFKGVLVKVNEQMFIFPAVSVQRVMRVKKEEIKTVENRETIQAAGRVISAVRLGNVLQISPRKNTGVSVKATTIKYIPIIIVSSEGKYIAFIVDEIMEEHQILVKSLGRQLNSVNNIAGAAVLGNGRIVPVVNIQDLMKYAVVTAETDSVLQAAEESTLKTGKILVAEDSITSRTLLKNILEAAGYHVATAVDGADAFAQVRSGDFELVVSDVDMPRMNGFELTTGIRADKKINELPVVLVTALESREDRERGIDAGASAYIVKSSFDQSNLLEVIRRLI